jgi:hypothetical protein
MSNFLSNLNPFRQGGQQAQQQQTPAVPAPGGQQQQVNNAPGSSMQPGGGQPQEQNPNSPLDAFKDIWQNDPNQQQNADPFANPLFQSDPTKIVEAANQQDFLRNAPPELMQKALGGDAQAMLDLVNHSTRQALALSLQLQTATTEQAGKRIGERFNQSLPNKFKEFSVRNQKASNPALEHPAVKQMMESTRDRFAAKYPDKRPEEIQAMTEDYFAQVSAAFQGGSPDGQKQQQALPGGGTDFGNWN